MQPIDLVEHPEGGRFREVFRSARVVTSHSIEDAEIEILIEPEIAILLSSDLDGRPALLTRKLTGPLPASKSATPRATAS